MPIMAPTYDQFSAFIQLRMNELNLSQNRLAELAKISPDTINRMANGKGPFGAQTLEKVAPFLKVDADYLKHLTGLVERRSTVIEDPEVVDIALQIERLIPDRRQQILQVFRATLALVQNAEDASNQGTQRDIGNKESPTAPGQPRSEIELGMQVIAVRAEMEKLPTIKEQMAFLRGVAMGDREVFNKLDEVIRELSRRGGAANRGDIDREAG